MLKITVEIVPYGDESKKRTIGSGFISNDGTGGKNLASYNCEFYTLDTKENFISKIKNHDRLKGFWHLIQKALLPENKIIKIPMTKEEIAKKYNVDINHLNKRIDGRIEWICEHGVGHTIYSPNGNYIHGCDGCCKKLFKK